MQRKSISYFYGSIASLVVGIGVGYWLGGWSAAFLVAVLSALEISLSFDNAVVNASVLNNWNRLWRNLFIWIGLPIAVFGMRLVFPILIVTMTTGLGTGETFDMAINRPDDYAAALTAVHHQVAAFGGAFLMMVAFEFFIDEEKEHHWIPGLEHLLLKLGTYQKAVGAGIVLASIVGISMMLPSHEAHEFLVAGVFGVITYVGVKFLAQALSGNSEGVGGLLYLEILDASFSFDGVIGAFAITNNLLIIMIGLGVGAMFVRSITIYLVDRGTLAQYRYLEHGAFWAILALAVIMFASVKVEIPEVITGLIGIGLIALSVRSSIVHNKAEAAKASAA